MVGQISLGQNKCGWHYAQMNDLQIDSANSNLFYATSTDGNAFIKVRLDSLTLVDVLVLNEESFRLNFFVKRPAQATGYILIRAQRREAFLLDPIQAFSCECPHNHYGLLQRVDAICQIWNRRYWIIGFGLQLWTRISYARTSHRAGE